MIWFSVSGKRHGLFDGSNEPFKHSDVVLMTALLLHGFAAHQVPLPRRTPQNLSARRYLEALGYGLFGLLHGFTQKRDLRNRFFLSL